MRDNSNNSDRSNEIHEEGREARAKERAERNPVYREDGTVREDRMQNMPDRQMAERNSPYKLAGEEGGDSNSPYQLPRDVQVHEIRLNEEGVDSHTWVADGSEIDGNYEYDEDGRANRRGGDGSYVNRGNTTTSEMANERRGQQGGQSLNTPKGASSGSQLNRADGDTDDSGINPINSSGTFSDQARSRQRYNAQSGGSHMNDERYNQDSNSKENSLPETVSLNNDLIDGPGKLDALTGGDDMLTETQNQMGMGQNQPARQNQGNRAVRGEHSQISHGGGTTSDFQREAYDASVDGQLVGQEEITTADTGRGVRSSAHGDKARDLSGGQSGMRQTRAANDSGMTIPSANQGSNQMSAMNQQTLNGDMAAAPEMSRQYDTPQNTAARNRDGSTAVPGEHSQVDREANGGTTRDWKNMPSSSYQGVAGITDADRQRGEMSTDWDGTSASEHPTSDEPGSDIRSRSTGGSTSQASTLGQ